MAYCTIEEFAEYVSSEISGDGPFLAAALAAAEDTINDYCGRAFDDLTTSITRYYVPAPCFVDIHDISDTSGVAITDNSVTVDVTDVQFEPVNSVSNSGLTTPKYMISRLTGAWSVPSNPRQATIAITSSHWGWATVPPQVKEATLILGKDIAHVRANRFGVAGFGEFGVVRVRDNPHVEMLLANLRHPSTIGIA